MDGKIHLFGAGIEIAAFLTVVGVWWHPEWLVHFLIILGVLVLLGTTMIRERKPNRFIATVLVGCWVLLLLIFRTLFSSLALSLFIVAGFFAGVGPDLDITIIGIKAHRDKWLHSEVLPVALFGVPALLFNEYPGLVLVACGFVVGWASHLRLDLYPMGAGIGDLVTRSVTDQGAPGDIRGLAEKWEKPVLVVGWVTSMAVAICAFFFTTLLLVWVQVLGLICAFGGLFFDIFIRLRKT